MAEHDREPPISDTGANPQDHSFGKEAAEEQERAERGQRLEHEGDTEPRPGGKAEPAG